MNLNYLPQAKRYIKKADPPLKKKLHDELMKIYCNPQKAKRLKGGKFKFVQCHSFSFNGVQYRIAYKKKESGILIVAISTRENFYKEVTIFI